MVKSVVKDEMLLAIKSRTALKTDSTIADNLLDTLKANCEECVGMAANMIGESVAIIVFSDGNGYTEMFNPKIIKATEPYQTNEGCLSLDGTREVKRFRNIKVRWQTRDFQMRTKNFSGFTAQIIQHEVDHISGIII